MAKFVTVSDYEIANAELIVGISLNIPEDNENLEINGRVSITISLTNNTCITIYDYRNIKKFFNDLQYHFYEGDQPDTYRKMYQKFLMLIGEDKDGTQMS